MTKAETSQLVALIDEIAKARRERDRLITATNALNERCNAAADTHLRAKGNLNDFVNEITA